MYRCLRAAVCLSALLLSVWTPRAVAADVRPNVVFILIDDMGWTDVGCFGSTYYETPNIDRLAAAGMKFTSAYAACAVCSPTRASILTGKYPARLHLTDYIPGEGDAPKNLMRIPEWRKFLPLEEVTIAEALKPAGYATASIGKWHLGGPAYFPQHQGFDTNVAGGAIGHPGAYFWPYGQGAGAVPGLARNGGKGEYLTDRLTDEAIAFVEHNKERPFFLYLPHYAVHMPLQAKQALEAKYKTKPASRGQHNATYAAMIESLDQGIGRLLAALDRLGIADRTIVVFMSDNGGVTHVPVTSNAPLRDGKGSPYEGGFREPLIVRWPGVVKAQTTCDVPVCSIDFLPTICEMAGVSVPAGVDGASLVPLLRGTNSAPHDALYWHYPHYWNGGKQKPYGAVRAGDWKLIEFFEDMRVELYNLKDDLSETRDLAAAKPDKAAELRAMLHAWRGKVGAQMPVRRSEGPAQK